MFLLAINRHFKNKNLTYLITKVTITNYLVKNTLSNIATLSKFMNIDKLYIICIIMSETFECETLELKEPSNIIYIEIGIKSFMEKILDNSEYNFWKYNRDTLYILKDGSFCDIKSLFTLYQKGELNIVRGNSQKSHVISPMDLRLSCYLLILYNMNYTKAACNNSYNILIKDRYLPSSE